ncbi:MAG: transcriptional repressor [Bacteroidota bacterium]
MKSVHNHHHCQQEAWKFIEQQCRERNLRLTPIRQSVLKEIMGSHKACKAYDIIQQLSTPDMIVKPPTVYRAIEFLLAQGFIHKIESINAFIACYHQHNANDCYQLFICDECGNISEQSDDKLCQQLKRESKQTGFTIRQPVVEVHGICAKCNQ